MNMTTSIPQLTNMENKTRLSNLGAVVSVRGSVVDIRWEQVNHGDLCSSTPGIQ